MNSTLVAVIIGLALALTLVYVWTGVRCALGHYDTQKEKEDV